MNAFLLDIDTDISSLRSLFLLYNVYVLTASKPTKITIPTFIYFFIINTYFYQNVKYTFNKLYCL